MPYPSDSQLVMDILHESDDGKVTQQEIQKEFDTSQTTVSNVIKRMEREGRVKTLLFRGSNLVFLPDVYHEMFGTSDTDDPSYRKVIPPNSLPADGGADDVDQTEDSEGDDA